MTEHRRKPTPALRGLLAAAALAMLFAGACSARDAEKAFHAGGKIAYDSFKAANQSRPR